MPLSQQQHSYLSSPQDKDSNQNFIKIAKFDSKFENCKTQGYCFRRLTVHGHDNSRTSFAVQLPSGRHCRREERVMQMFRTFNGYAHSSSPVPLTKCFAAYSCERKRVKSGTFISMHPSPYLVARVCALSKMILRISR